jgi:hypothetical protein
LKRRTSAENTLGFESKMPPFLWGLSNAPAILQYGTEVDPQEPVWDGFTDGGQSDGEDEPQEEIIPIPIFPGGGNYTTV